MSKRSTFKREIRHLVTDSAFIPFLILATIVFSAAGGFILAKI